MFWQVRVCNGGTSVASGIGRIAGVAFRVQSRTHSQLVACVRAGIIALFLLVVLVLIILV